MTPCNSDRTPDYDNLVETGKKLMDAGMPAMNLCGSMGDWPVDRRATPRRRSSLGGLAYRPSSEQAPKIPRKRSPTPLIPRKSGPTVDGHPTGSFPGNLSFRPTRYFSAILDAGDTLPAVIYNSPYYGFETKADLFFDLRRNHPNLIGFKEFGGSDSLSYAAEHITTGIPI